MRLRHERQFDVRTSVSLTSRHDLALTIPSYEMRRTRRRIFPTIGPVRPLFSRSEHDRVSKQSHLVRDAERLPNLRAMELDSTWTDTEEFRDLTTALALAYQVEDLSLAGGQAIEGGIFKSSAIAEAAPRNLGRDVTIATQHVLDRAVQLVRARTFGDESVCATLQREIGERTIEMHRDDKDT